VPAPPQALPPLPPVRGPEAAVAAPAAGTAVPELPPVGDSTGKPASGRSEEVSSFIRWVVEFVVLVVAAFLLATGIKTWVVQPFYIPSGSMEPTLAIGDRVLVNKFIYRFTSPKRGDVVVFESPEGPKTDLIKRVIATGGQTVQIKDGYVSVDGTKLDEPYVAKDRRDNYTSPTPTKVPQGYVWVMGDNRGNSADSRVIGPQPLSAILGQAFTIYWPIQRFGGL
jgi:signal peptidase I